MKFKYFSDNFTHWVLKKSSSIHSNPVFPQQLTRLLGTLGYAHVSPGLAVFFIVMGESPQWVSSNILRNNSFIRVVHNDIIIRGGNCISRKNTPLYKIFVQLIFP